MNKLVLHEVQTLLLDYHLHIVADIERQIGDVKTLFQSVAVYRNQSTHFNRHLQTCVAIRNMKRFPELLGVVAASDVPVTFNSDTLEEIEELTTPSLADETGTPVAALSSYHQQIRFGSKFEPTDSK